MSRKRTTPTFEKARQIQTRSTVEVDDDKFTLTLHTALNMGWVDPRIWMNSSYKNIFDSLAKGHSLPFIVLGLPISETI